METIYPYLRLVAPYVALALALALVVLAVVVGSDLAGLAHDDIGSWRWSRRLG